MKQNHRSLISALVLAGLLTPALMLSGCDGDSAASATAQAAKADVGISIEFPATGASAARIDDAATAVLVEIWDATNQTCEVYGCYGEPTKSVTLERPVGGGTVSASLLGVSPGEAVVRVKQLSGVGEDLTTLETVNVSANLTEGQNDMTVTLIRAAWTLQTPVTFNKIVSTDTTRIDSFSLVPYSYEYQAQASATGNVDGVMKASIDQSLMLGASLYATVLKGSNLCAYDSFDDYGGYGGTITCGQTQLVDSYYQDSGLIYFNRMDSASTANSYAMLSGANDMPLAYDDQDRERGWFAFSVDPEGKILEFNENDPFPDETASDPAVWDDFKIDVTGGSTIQGNLIEWLTKSVSTSNRKCYSDYEFTTEITCPAQVTAARAGASVKHGNTFRAALANKLNALKAGPEKAAADANGCYTNLQISYKNWDYGGYDSGTQTYWYYAEDETEVADVCRHPFTATATQLTSTDVDLVNQARMVSAKAAKR